MSVSLLWSIPFVLLLSSIAVLPLLAKQWWEKKYAWISLGLGMCTVAYYLAGLHRFETLWHTAQDYLSFISLITCLFIVSGGIHIRVKGEAKPWVNCLFLFVGAVLANFLGTTGASMVLIRPWIRMNKYRITAAHIVFFIFIVSNVGGCLTPIGDPPLFLGYLKGVPFFWVMQNIWPVWFWGVGLILAVFFVWDTLNYHKAPKSVREKETAHEEWKFDGAHNVLFLLIILGSVFIHHPLFLREALMGLAAFFSYRTTSKVIHQNNEFHFSPIVEVAILFAGIFMTMIPALEWLEHHAAELGIQTAGQFYWGSGILSSFLDNAPTYLNFLSVAIGLLEKSQGDTKTQVADLLRHYPAYVKAISVGSVFFGAMTYIGNGPNFLVKAIAEHAKVKTPSFFGYIFRFSLPVLLPVFGLVWFFFFRI